MFLEFPYLGMAQPTLPMRFRPVFCPNPQLQVFLFGYGAIYDFYEFSLNALPDLAGRGPPRGL